MYYITVRFFGERFFLGGFISGGFPRGLISSVGAYLFYFSYNYAHPTAACDNNIILREFYYHNLDRTIWLEIIFTPACTDVRKIKPQLDSASELPNMTST